MSDYYSEEDYSDAESVSSLTSEVFVIPDSDEYLEGYYIKLRLNKYLKQYDALMETFNEYGFDSTDELLECQQIVNTMRDLSSSLFFMVKLVKQKKYNDAVRVEKNVKHYLEMYNKDFAAFEEVTTRHSI